MRAFVNVGGVVLLLVGFVVGLASCDAAGRFVEIDSLDTHLPKLIDIYPHWVSESGQFMTREPNVSEPVQLYPQESFGEGEIGLIIPILDTNGMRVYGWSVHRGKKCYVVDTSLDAIQGFVGTDYNGICAAQLVDPVLGEFLVGYKFSPEDVALFAVRSGEQSVMYMVDGEWLIGSTYFNSELILFSMDGVGICAIDRSSGDLHVVVETEERVTKFAVYEQGLLLWFPGTYDKWGDVCLYEFSGLTAENPVALIRGKEIAEFDQFGQWVLLLGDYEDYYLVDISAGVVYETGPLASGDVDSLLQGLGDHAVESNMTLLGVERAENQEVIVTIARHHRLSKVKNVGKVRFTKRVGRVGKD